MSAAGSSDGTPLRDAWAQRGSSWLADVSRPGRSSRLVIWADVAVIALLSVVAQMTHFSAQKGRTVINGDSAQFVAAAEALVSGDKTPHFEMRKPAYSLLLRGCCCSVETWVGPRSPGITPCSRRCRSRRMDSGCTFGRDVSRGSRLC